MKPVATFQAQSRHFWAHVKLLSEGLGYSSNSKLKRYTLTDLKQFLASYGLEVHHLNAVTSANMAYGDLIIAYITHRAEVLETFVMPNLMSREQAKVEFEQLSSVFQGTLPPIYNKQRNEKHHPAYLTC